LHLNRDEHEYGGNRYGVKKEKISLSGYLLKCFGNSFGKVQRIAPLGRKAKKYATNILKLAASSFVDQLVRINTE
jgi:hypothetical protein